MKWDTKMYSDKHDFVTEYGKELLTFVPDDKNQRILDLGCGTGVLTNELSKKSDHVIGVDSSREMIHQARENYPDLSFEVKDACHLDWEEEFDIVFSNAVFHWIITPDVLLRSIHKALAVGGKLICEFGAAGNIFKIQKAFEGVAKEQGYNYESPFYFPTIMEYGSLLEEIGFDVEFIEDYDRLTPLKDGEEGLKNWMKQFFAGSLEEFSEEVQENILKEIEEDLKEDLYDGSKWFADYRRIRVIAEKK